MDLDTLENLWRRQTLAGATPAADALIAQMEREVTHARRRIRGGIVLAACVLALGWGLSVVGYLTGIKPPTAVGLVSEAVGFALYVAFFARAAQSLRAVREAEAALGGTLRESMAATLRIVELQIAHARLAAVAIPLVVAISAWLLGAKHFAGEMPGFGAWIGSAFTALLGGAIGGAMWHRYRTRLRPRRGELQAELRALDEEPSR